MRERSKRGPANPRQVGDENRSRQAPQACKSLTFAYSAMFAKDNPSQATGSSTCHSFIPSTLKRRSTIDKKKPVGFIRSDIGGEDLKQREGVNAAAAADNLRGACERTTTRVCSYPAMEHPGASQHDTLLPDIRDVH